MNIINLTQHNSTIDQQNAGVVDFDNRDAIQSLLTFNSIPSVQDMYVRAQTLASFAIKAGYTYAMIGGAPYFMSILEKVLLQHHITPLYSFSVRQSNEERDENGNVRKVNIFKHIGFVEVS